MSLVNQLAVMTNAIVAGELAWRDNDYDTQAANAEVSERAMDRVGDDLGHEQASAVHSALVLAVAKTRAAPAVVDASHAEHLTDSYTFDFIRENIR